MKKTALITGVAGQDGSYLAELLLSKGYRVVGTSRANLGDSFTRIRHVIPGVEMASGDLLIEDSLVQLIDNVKPTEVYNLAAQSSLSDYLTHPVMTAEISGLAVTRLLEAIRLVDPKIKFFQASSSEMFGNTSQTPQSEITSFQPNNLYAIAKVYAHTVTSYYRDTHNIFACSGILYNHESPRRNIEFVTRKVTAAAAAIKLGISDSVQLGNLDAKRDWSFAGDFVNGMWLMLQYSLPDDYILASGKVHSIRELCEIAFSHVGLDYKDYVLQDARYLRAPEQVIRVGDSSKAERVLGWNRSIDFANLVRMMVDSDLADLSKKSSKVV